MRPVRPRTVLLTFGLALAAVLTAPPTAVIATVGPVSVQGNPTAPVQVVTDAADEIQVIIQSGDLSRRQKRERMEAMLSLIMDVPHMSRLVMARNWKKFSETQQAAFVEQFRRNLVMTYFNNVVNAEIARIEVEEPRVDEKYGHVQIMTRVILALGGKPVLIEYRLHRSNDGQGPWMIIDLSVEEIRLVSNFRSQFKSVFSNNGADGLIRLLREKNDALEERELKHK